MLRTPFDLRQLLTPGGAIPDLEVVVDSGDDDVPAELRVLDERARKHQPALLVELRLRRAGEEEPVEPAPLLAERIQRGELRLDESIPIRTTVGVEAPVEPARDDDPLGEGFPELGRKGETVLVIDRVLVLAEEHVRGLGLAFHFAPLYPTALHNANQKGDPSAESGGEAEARCGDPLGCEEERRRRVEERAGGDRQRERVRSRPAEAVLLAKPLGEQTGTREP